METLRLSLKMVLSIVLPLAAQRWDRRRLTPEQRDAAWNEATWAAALYALGPASMIGWCWVTRGTWRGQPGFSWTRVGRGLRALGLGFTAALVFGTMVGATDYLLAVALGLPP
jgi:hypothetical protein